MKKDYIMRNCGRFVRDSRGRLCHLVRDSRGRLHTVVRDTRQNEYSKKEKIKKVGDAAGDLAERFVAIMESAGCDAICNELVQYLSDDEMKVLVDHLGSLWGYEWDDDWDAVSDSAASSVRVRLMQALDGIADEEKASVAYPVILSSILSPIGIAAKKGSEEEGLLIGETMSLRVTPDEKVVITMPIGSEVFSLWDMTGWVDYIKERVPRVSDAADNGELLAVVSEAVSKGFTYSEDASIKEVIEGAKAFLKAQGEQVQDSKAAPRTDFIFPASSSDVNDGEGHYPLNSVARGRAALAMAAKAKSLPKWYSGKMSLEEFKKFIRGKVQKTFPSIEVNMDSKK